MGQLAQLKDQLPLFEPVEPAMAGQLHSSHFNRQGHFGTLPFCLHCEPVRRLERPGILSIFGIQGVFGRNLAFTSGDVVQQGLVDTGIQLWLLVFSKQLSGITKRPRGDLDRAVSLPLLNRGAL